MSVQTDQWLADYERRIVTMWTVAAFVAYATIACAAIGILMIRDVPMGGAGLSAHGRSFDGAERTLTLGSSSAPRWRSPLVVEDVRSPAETVVGSVPEIPAPEKTPENAADEKPVPLNIIVPEPIVEELPLLLGLAGSGEQPIHHRISMPPLIARAGGLVSAAPGTRPAPELLAAIMSWVSSNFDLPEARDLPQVELVPQLRLATLRFRGLVSDRQPPGLEVSPEQARNVVALYDDVRRTIYLQDSWSGTAAELSVLAHEMVHHLQNVGAVKYECPQAREKPAYLAQREWLGLFGLNLLDEFEIDPMTVLVRSLCVF